MWHIIIASEFKPLTFGPISSKAVKWLEQELKMQHLFKGNIQLRSKKPMRKLFEETAWMVVQRDAIVRAQHNVQVHNKYTVHPLLYKIYIPRRNLCPSLGSILDEGHIRVFCIRVPDKINEILSCTMCSEGFFSGLANMNICWLSRYFFSNSWLYN